MAAFARAAEARIPPRLFHLWPEHVPALGLWLDVQTQWRIAPSGRFTGLDYPGVHAVLQLSGRPRAEQRERFAELQVMERAAIAAWAQQASGPTVPRR